MFILVLNTVNLTSKILMNRMERRMKQYRVCKAWPGVEVGAPIKSDVYNCICVNAFHYHRDEVARMLKEGWIEEVVTRKTLEDKLKDRIVEFEYTPWERISNLAKDHYLELLDEAERYWNNLRDKDKNRIIPVYEDNEHRFQIFLRKYLETEGKMGAKT